MAKSNIQESQQQGQHVTIGTQGNEDQVTPQGNDQGRQQRGDGDKRHIPNQEKSSAGSQRDNRGRQED